MATSLIETGIERTPGLPVQSLETTSTPLETVHPRIVVTEYDPSDKDNWLTHQITKAFHEDSTYSIWPEKEEDGHIKVTANTRSSVAYIEFFNRPLIQALSQSFDRRQITYIEGSSDEQCRAIHHDLEQIAKKTSSRSKHLRGRIMATYAQSAIDRFELEGKEQSGSDNYSIGEHTNTRSQIEGYLRSQRMYGCTPFGSGSVDNEDITGLLQEEIEAMKAERNDQLIPTTGNIFTAAD